MTDFFSARFSSAQQLPNGNILICMGPQGEFFEIDSNEEIGWNYINPVTRDGPLIQGDSPAGVNPVFRVLKYGTDYPAFTGKTLTPQGNIELEPPVLAINDDAINKNFEIYPNPVKFKLQILGLDEKVNETRIYDLHGEAIQISRGHNINEIDISSLANGVYLLSINNKIMKKFIIAR